VACLKVVYRHSPGKTEGGFQMLSKICNPADSNPVPPEYVCSITIIIIIIIIIMALQPFVAPWPLFQFLDSIHSR
jgi:hypothetical protein